MNAKAFGEKFDSLLESIYTDLSTPEKKKRALEIRNIWKCYIEESNRLELLEERIVMNNMIGNTQLVAEWGQLTALTNSMYFLFLSEIDPENQSLLKMEFEARRETGQLLNRQL